MREFKELLETVTRIDSQSPSRAVSYIMVDLKQGEPLSAPPKGYRELAAEIASMETGAQPRQKPHPPVQAKPKPMPAAKPAPQQKAPPMPPSPEDVKKKQQSRPAFKISLFNRKQPRPAAAPQAPEPSQPAPLTASAAQELDRVVASSKMEKVKAPKQVFVRQSGLVLPVLSLSDQISELDKIIANLKESRFTPDQLEIVRSEVFGLYQEIQENPSESEALQGDLVDLRTVKIREAISLMGGS